MSLQISYRNGLNCHYGPKGKVGRLQLFLKEKFMQITIFSEPVDLIYL